MSVHAPTRGLVVVVLIAATALVAGCGGEGENAGGAAGSFDPVAPDTLTVATTFPVPGFWEGSDVAHPSGGFEYELALELAAELDLETVKVVDVSFADLVAGKAKGFDIGLAEVSVTDERGKRVAFSQPYLTTPVGVVGRAGTEVHDLAAARPLRWGVTDATTEVDVVDDLVQPDTAVTTFPTSSEMLSAVAGGLVDVAAMDYVMALVDVHANEQLGLAAQIVAPQHYAAVLPKGSDNLDAVNSAIRRLEADGSLEQLREALYEPYGVDENKTPTIRVTPS